MISQTFCPHPFWGMTIDNQGLLHPCAASRPIEGQQSVAKTSLKDQWNSQGMREIRLAMQQGQRPKTCEKCFYLEDAGVQSKRGKALEKYSDRLGECTTSSNAQGEAPLALRILNLRLGNKCNLRCRMCGPLSSRPFITEWSQSRLPSLRQRAEEQKAQPDWSLKPEVWQELSQHLSQVEHINFAGGEPLLYEEYFPLLQAAIDSGESKHIHLSFNTNLTHLPQPLKLWAQHFAGLTLDVSIDGYGALNEFIRHPSKWERIHHNFNLLRDWARDLPRLYVDVATTISVYNVLQLPELFAYLTEHPFQNGVKLPNFVMVYSPRMMDARAMPLSFKREAQARLKHFIANFEPGALALNQSRLQDLRRIVSYLDAPEQPELVAQLRILNGEYDRLRAQDSKNFEFAQWLWNEAAPPAIREECTTLSF